MWRTTPLKQPSPLRSLSLRRSAVLCVLTRACVGRGGCNSIECVGIDRSPRHPHAHVCTTHTLNPPPRARSPASARVCGCMWIKCNHDNGWVCTNSLFAISKQSHINSNHQTLCMQRANTARYEAPTPGLPQYAAARAVCYLGVAELGGFHSVAATFQRIVRGGTMAADASRGREGNASGSLRGADAGGAVDAMGATRLAAG